MDIPWVSKLIHISADPIDDPDMRMISKHIHISTYPIDNIRYPLTYVATYPLFQWYPDMRKISKLIHIFTYPEEYPSGYVTEIWIYMDICGFLTDIWSWRQHIS
jgi:hypothetical protein